MSGISSMELGPYEGTGKLHSIASQSHSITGATGTGKLHSIATRTSWAHPQQTQTGTLPMLSSVGPGELLFKRVRVCGAWLHLNLFAGVFANHFSGKPANRLNRTEGPAMHEVELKETHPNLGANGTDPFTSNQI